MSKIGGGRLLRVCDLCGGVDDAPRHVFASSPDIVRKPSEQVIGRVRKLAPPDQVDRLLAELLDTDSADFHLDCCRDAGCPDRSCDRVTAGAEDLRDGDLLAHLTKEA